MPSDIDPKDYLSDQQKISILDQRTNSFAADAFAHELNKDSILGIDPEANTEEQDNAIAQIKKMISENEAKRTEIAGETLKEAIVRVSNAEKVKAVAEEVVVEEVVNK